VCALRRENALAQSSPLYRSQGHVSRRGAQARNPGRNAPRERCGRALEVERPDIQTPPGSDRFTKLSRAGLSGRMVSGRGERLGRHEEIRPVLIVLFIV
jgi:hypothetical protein